MPNESFPASVSISGDYFEITIGSGDESRSKKLGELSSLVLKSEVVCDLFTKDGSREVVGIKIRPKIVGGQEFGPREYGDGPSSKPIRV